MQFLKRLKPMTLPQQNSTANTIYVDTDTEQIKVGTGASGSTERILSDSTEGAAWPDGDVNNPAAYFTSDPDNGFFRDGENTVASSGHFISRGNVTSVGTTAVASTTATPAGGAVGIRLVFGTTAGFGIYVGSGAPTVTAAQGSLYLRSDGSSTTTRAYINTDGATTWTAISTVA